MRLVRGAVLSSLVLVQVACKTTAGAEDSSQVLQGGPAAPPVAPPEGNTDPDLAPDNGAGGTITVWVIPPAKGLDWSTPNQLTLSTVKSKAQGEINKQLGRVVLPHPIGHLHVSMDCEGLRIPLTGQTGGGSEYVVVFDGMGASFRTFPGALDKYEDVKPDFDARLKSGMIAGLRFKIDQKMCKHMAGFVKEYLKRGAEKKYGGQFRPRRWEGSGCTAFGLAFVEIGGFMKRSEYTPLWAQTLKIGIGRVADYKGTGVYEYGSNLQTLEETGEFVQWPKKREVRVQRKAIAPGSPWLQDWTETNDAGTNPDPANQPNFVPWTIYDTEPMWAFIEDLAERGGGEGMGRTWTVEKDGKATVLVSDARGATPVPYEDTQDDLRKD